MQVDSEVLIEMLKNQRNAWADDAAFLKAALVAAEKRISELEAEIHRLKAVLAAAT